MPQQQTCRRVAVLVSGRGSNMEALLTSHSFGQLPCARFVLVVSNVPDAPALEKAARFGVPTRVLNHKDYPNRAAFDTALVAVLREHQVELVCLAGFMRILSPVMIEAFPHAILNIHPSLLPAFPGVDAQRQAFEYGVRITGLTVHFVDSGVDTGPIVLQRAIPVEDTDTAESLAERILKHEHLAYVDALKWVTENDWRVEGRRVVLNESPDTHPYPHEPL